MPNIIVNSVLEDASEETIISVLSHQRLHILHGVIRITEAAVLPNLRTSSSSSLGDLDSFSVELLHAILALLDYQTLLDISKTCLRGAAIVKSVPQYRDVIQHAPQTVVALSRTRLIRHHCAATVHAALLSADCVSCGSYGAFLFLPTCQRCCNYCLWRNQSLWVVPIALAKTCFRYSAAGASTLPIMCSIPGRYFIRHMISRLRSTRLVCVGTAKKLALAENISEEIMRQNLDARSHSGLTLKQYHTQRILLEAPLTPPGSDFCGQPTESNIPNDMFCGMASIPFPYVVRGSHVEHGLWCLGCEAFCREWWLQDPTPAYLSHMVARGCNPTDVVEDMQDIARSKIDFLKHVHECPGAKGVFLARNKQQGVD